MVITEASGQVYPAVKYSISNIVTDAQNEKYKISDSKFDLKITQVRAQTTEGNSVILQLTTWKGIGPNRKHSPVDTL